VRAVGFEPTTVGFGVQRSTVGATPSADGVFKFNSVKFKDFFDYLIFKFILSIFCIVDIKELINYLNPLIIKIGQKNIF
jgi:hypothetical protein